MLVPGVVFPPQPVSAVDEDNSYKFDAGFYELIYPQSSPSVFDPNAEIRKQYVLINVVDGYENQLKEILNEMGAENIFVSTVLDFVSADIPVDRIVELIDYDFIYKLGDEPELEPQGLSMSQAKAVVGYPSFTSDNYGYTGDGVTVGVIDTGVDFSHPDLSGKKVGKVNCVTTCVSSSSIHDHGTALAGIIAGDSSTNSRDGVASDSRIYNVVIDKALGNSDVRVGYLSRALDNIVTSGNDIKIAMTSLGAFETCNNYSALSIVVDKAVDSGISFSVGVGNSDRRISTTACGFNSISVGSVNSNGILHSQSSQGPAQFETPSGDTGRIKPEITAIGHNIDLAKVVRNGESNYKTGSGTSYANAFVAGASALIKEKQSDYDSLEIKSALLIGADWKATVPATANDYDNQRSGIYNTMNKYGFGVLNIEKSLEYTNDNSFPNVLSDVSANNFPDLKYRITATQGEQVKVLLSWFIHPGNTISSPTLPIQSSYVSLPNQFHDYNLKVTYPDGTIKRSASNIQNNEFVVFDAPQTGNYDIIVSSDGDRLLTVAGEPFVIASTHGIDKFPFSTDNSNRGGDITPPEIEITSPYNRYTSSSTTITIRGESSDNVEVESVKLYVNNNLISTLTSNLDEWSVNVTLPRSTNTIKAVAEDTSGNSSTDTLFIFYSEPSNPPRKTVTPTSGSVTSASATISWSAPSAGDSPIIGYDIFREASPKILIATVPSTQLSYVDSTVLPSTTYQYTVSAKNQYGSGEESNPITITTLADTEKPVLSSISDVTIDEGETKSFTVSATDQNNDSITYSLSNSPDWVSISGDTITVAAPNELPNTSYSGTVTATTRDGSDTESFTININEINEQPIINNISDKSAEEQSTIQFTITASDSDIPAQSLSFSITGDLDGAVIDSTTGLFTWTPNNSQVGTHSITFTVTDNGTPAKSDSQDVVFTITEILDITAPTPPTINQPQTPTTNDSLTLTGTGEVGYKLLLRINGVDFSMIKIMDDGTWSTDLVLAQGPTTFTAVVGNPAGDVSAVSDPVTVTLDTGIPISPVINQLSSSTTNESSITITGTAPSGLVVTLTHYDNEFQAISPLHTVTANDDGTWSFDVILLEGRNMFTATATDDEGNRSSRSEHVIVTLDIIPPIITPTQNSLLNDSFDDSLDGWQKYSFTGTNSRTPYDNYNLSLDSTIGKPSPSAHISGDGFVSNSGIYKTVDITSVSEDSSLYLSFDYRATSNYVASSITNTRMGIYDGVTGETLHHESLIAGGVGDSGWQSYNTDISSMTSGHDSITIRLYLNDSWIAYWNQQNWYDNITLGTEQQPIGQQSPTPSETYAPSSNDDDVTLSATITTRTSTVNTAESFIINGTSKNADQIGLYREGTYTNNWVAPDDYGYWSFDVTLNEGENILGVNVINGDGAMFSPNDIIITLEHYNSTNYNSTSTNYN